VLVEQHDEYVEPRRRIALTCRQRGTTMNEEHVLAGRGQIPSLGPRDGIRRLTALEDFDIVTDSVVATATIKTGKEMRRIVVDWGDDVRDTVDHRPGVPAPPATPGANPLPPGTYELSHAYEEPDDRRPFEQLVVLRVDGGGESDFRFANIVLTPRYRVTAYPLIVAATGPCDPGWFGSVTFEITQLIDGRAVRQWEWETSNNIFTQVGGFRLEGSQVSRELTIADPYVPVRFHFVDYDDWSFDDELIVSYSMYASQESESVQLHDEIGGLFNSCGIRANFDREVALIARLPQGDEWPVATTNG
jgi:hypothetical protein